MVTRQRRMQQRQCMQYALTSNLFSQQQQQQRRGINVLMQQ
jgi:hypothetical protein